MHGKLIIWLHGMGVSHKDRLMYAMLNKNETIRRLVKSIL